MIETRKSFCRFCHVFCGVEVDIEDGRVVDIRGDRDNPVSQGYTCLKGRADAERLYHPERLRASRKRTGEDWADIESTRALDEIGAKLRAIVDRHGPRSVAVYVGDGGHRTSAADPSFVRKWLDALGSPGLYTSYTVDSPSLAVATNRLFGAPLPLGVLDITHADVVMFVATNPTISHLMSMPQSNPSARLRGAQRRGMKLIVVDPRRCDVAKRADIHLQVKPGEDASLLAGMIKVIIERGLYDREYADAFLSGVDDLHAAVRPFDLDYVSRRTEVPAGLIADAAVLFASAPSGAAQSGTGLHMARHQNLTTQLVMTLNALCGRYDRRGGMTRHAGVLNRPLPENPGPIPVPLFSGEETQVRGIKGIYNWQGLREMPANTLGEAILAEGAGKIRALIVNGGNPALVFPDSRAGHRGAAESRPAGRQRPVHERDGAFRRLRAGSEASLRARRRSEADGRDLPLPLQSVHAAAGRGLRRRHGGMGDLLGAGAPSRHHPENSRHPHGRQADRRPDARRPERQSRIPLDEVRRYPERSRVRRHRDAGRRRRAEHDRPRRPPHGSRTSGGRRRARRGAGRAVDRRRRRTTPRKSSPSA